MAEIGWISIHRKLGRHWLWEYKPFSYGQAWITILMECNHAERKVNLGNFLYHVKRGESINSLDTWGNIFGWNKSKVRRFFELLKSDGMIDTKPTHNTTHLTVLNYSSYQDVTHGSETKVKQTWNEGETNLTPNNNDNNINNGNNDNKKRFAPPTMDEVIKLFIEKGSTKLEAEKFFYFYESKNWMVGKVKMKSWTASVSGWIARNKAKEIEDRGYVSTLE